MCSTSMPSIKSTFTSTPSKVWRLNKSLYGLKQSGRNWNTTLDKHLTENGFVKSKADPCLFTKSAKGEIVHLLVWIDDIIVAASNQENLDETKALLHEKFDMKDLLGELKYFLGIKFERTVETISMSQKDYIDKILKKSKCLHQRLQPIRRST